MKNFCMRFEIKSLSADLHGMKDAFAPARIEREELPRAPNFIVGPSRTGDIEKTIVPGAPGLYRVRIVIVCDA